METQRILELIETAISDMESASFWIKADDIKTAKERVVWAMEWLEMLSFRLNEKPLSCG